jgi:aryl-alcohol dehydrogenase-like predicted oxidoreductase
MNTTRRDFLRTTSAAAVLSPVLLRGESDKLGKLLPQREFGPKKEMITAFGIGGYHVGKAKNVKIAEAIVEKAMEKGVRVFDNAVQYQDGGSETLYGKVLTPKYRDHIFLTTKSGKTTAKEVRKEFEDSLRRMKTDHLDLWQLHAFTSVENVKERIEGGVVEVFLEMREKKLARYIGFTGHSDQRAHCYFLDHCKKEGIHMDSCLMPVNLAETHYDSFLTNVLPKLQEQKTDLFAMKTMVFGRIFEHAKKLDPDILTPKNLHEYAYSLPICCMLSGCETAEQVEQNTAILENYKGMDAKKRDELVAAVEKISGQDLEYYKKKA